VDLARLALSLQTDGQVPPQALARNIVYGDHRRGDPPPAKQDRTST
jgi:hypothetical protein